MLTADAPVLGSRLRDLRRGFRLPGHIRPANLPGEDAADPAGHARSEFDPALDWSVIRWLSSVSGLPVLVKGILAPDDVPRALDAGAAGVIVSNHGGRQLDGAPAPLDVLPGVVAAAAGYCPVLLDGGVRRGADVLAALALGADAVLVGRPVLHGLADAGADGALRVLEILKEELREAMTLCGLGSVDRSVRAAVLRTGGGPERAAAVLAHAAPIAIAPIAIAPIATAPIAAAPTAPAGPPIAAPAAAPAAPSAPPATLLKSELHASLSDPTLDTMGFLNEVTHRFPDALSFAPGRPYEGFFDVETVFAHIRRYLDHLAASGRSPEDVRNSLYQYGPTAGMIRELIAESLRLDEGIEVAPESVVVTVGAQEAMILVLRALIAGPQDVLLVAAPCYVGITGAAKLLDVPIALVSERADGLHAQDVAALVHAERARGRRPRALYLVPDHSNPSGGTLTPEARSGLLDLARPRGPAAAGGQPVPAGQPGGAAAHAEEPGPRPARGAPRLLRQVRLPRRPPRLRRRRPGGARSGRGRGRPAGGRADQDQEHGHRQHLPAEPGRGGRAAAGGRRPAGRGQRAGRRALRRQPRRPDRRAGAALPARAGRGARGTWNRPSGGFFLCLRVPFRADEAALNRSAAQFGVLWTPMAYFYPDGGGEQEIRLAFSYLSPDQIRAALDRLARFIAAETALQAAGGARGGLNPPPAPGPGIVHN